MSLTTTASKEASKYVLYRFAEYAITYIYNAFKPKNFNATEAYMTKVATLLEQITPEGKFNKFLDSFIALEKKGGIKNLTQTEIETCTTKLNIETKEAKKIAHCLEVTFEDNQSTDHKVFTFFTCYPTTPQRALEILDKSINFAGCLQHELIDLVNKGDEL